MRTFILTGPWPTCKRCNVRMDYWSPYMDEYECVPCTADRISDAMIAIVKKQFEEHAKIQNRDNTAEGVRS